MSFVEQIKTAKSALQELQRLSFRALERELQIDSETLEDVVDELVEVQQVARREGKVLVWVGHPPISSSADARNTSQPAPLSPEGTYTPKHIANKILASRSAMEGEKKQVTVLFCDVAASMELAAALGAEAWHDTLDQFFKVLTQAVHAQDGTVNQYTGDGIMALFGAPIAAEDHAQRACRAALQIQQSLCEIQQRVQSEFGQQLAARIGLNSGEVVVGRIGDDLRMDYTAQGQVVGIAARLEALAPAGGILVSPFTRKLVEGFFEFDNLGQQPVKGVSQPLAIHRLMSERQDATRLGIARERGFSPFVGRDVEMGVLKQAFRRAQSRQGQVVGIVAPPGTGKSRLCWEFRQYCAAHDEVLILPVTCQQHRRHVPYAANDQIMAVVYGFEPNDTPTQKRQKIRDKHLAWDSRSESHLPLSYEWLGVTDPDQPPPAMSPEEKRLWARKAVIWTMKHLCAGHTLVFMIEDVQWQDSASAEVSSLWRELASRDRVLLVWNARPEVDLDGRTGLPHVQLMHLHALDNDAVEAMLRNTLGDDPSLKGLTERILKASGGNPFFVEEIVRGLVDQGDLQALPGHYSLVRPVTELPLPESVHSLIAARIDRLGDQDKALLQAVSILGKDFEFSTAAAVSELVEEDALASLTRLEQAEFVSAADSSHYQFKHGLILEVASNSLLQTRRTELHRFAAQKIAQQSNQDIGTCLALARHWEHAGDTLAAAQCTHQAARQMLRRDIKEAIALFREYLRLEASQADNRALYVNGIIARRALIDWNGVAPLSKSQARQYYEDGQRMAEALNDPTRLCSIRLAYSLRLQNEARFEEAAKVVESAAALMSGINNPQLELVLNGLYRGFIYTVGGRLTKAWPAIERARELLTEQPDFGKRNGLNVDSAVQVLYGLALGLSGQLIQARAAMMALGSRLRSGDSMAMFAPCWLAILGRLSGDSESAAWAIEALQSYMATAEQRFGPWWTVGGRSWSGIAFIGTGDFSTALNHIDDAEKMHPDNDGIGTVLLPARAEKALALHRLGRSDEAIKQLHAVEQDIFDSGSYMCTGLYCWNKSIILRECHGLEAANEIQSALNKLQDCVQSGKLELMQHLWLWESARLNQLRGDKKQAAETLAAALQSATACEAFGHQEMITKELAAS